MISRAQPNSHRHSSNPSTTRPHLPGRTLHSQCGKHPAKIAESQNPSDFRRLIKKRPDVTTPRPARPSAIWVQVVHTFFEIRPTGIVESFTQAPPLGKSTCGSISCADGCSLFDQDRATLAACDSDDVFHRRLTRGSTQTGDSGGNFVHRIFAGIDTQACKWLKR